MQSIINTAKVLTVISDQLQLVVFEAVHMICFTVDKTIDPQFKNVKRRKNNNSNLVKQKQPESD